ncbi:MAG: secretin N-terminal domain-containing protein, partial [Campylobacterota bacterium]|nr:secretin N-terminal domain-containing protein [Campylobacterota bacterium]
MKFIKRPIYLAIATLFLSTHLSADCSYELFTISSVKNTKIIDFVDQLSDECEFTIIIADPLAETILNKKLNKTHIKNLTINEVFAIIINENNLSYTLKDNILKISYLTTKTFTIDYILSQRKGMGSTDITLSSQSNTQDSSSSAGSENKSSAAQSGISITSNDEVKFWEELDL